MAPSVMTPRALLLAIFAPVAFSSAIPSTILGQGLPTLMNRQSDTGAAAFDLCGQYANHQQGDYDFNNNLWGKDNEKSGQQCTHVDGNTANTWSTSWTWTGNENNVASYAHSGLVFEPNLVNNISSLPTTISWGYNTSDIRANVAYDIFTAADKNHDKGSGDYELMIWLNRYGGVGPVTEGSGPIASMDLVGHNWDLYKGTVTINGKPQQVYSFLVKGDPINNFSADVKEFFNYLVQYQNFPESSQHMLIFQAGTEAFTGGPAEFRVANFSAAVQSS